MEKASDPDSPSVLRFPDSSGQGFLGSVAPNTTMELPVDGTTRTGRRARRPGRNKWGGIIDYTRDPKLEPNPNRCLITATLHSGKILVFSLPVEHIFSPHVLRSWKAVRLEYDYVSPELLASIESESESESGITLAAIESESGTVA